MDKIDNLLKTLSDILLSKNITIAIAESCTGGLIGHLLTNISGSSKYFERGIISYSNQAKMDLLNVSEELLNEFGAVSEPVAKAMAEGIRKKSGVDIGISSTGVAGPTGGTKQKPVGRIYIGLSTRNDTIVRQYNFSGNRLENKLETAEQALILLIETLEQKI